MATIYICPKCGEEYKINRDDETIVTNLVCQSCDKVFMANEKNTKRK